MFWLDISRQQWGLTPQQISIHLMFWLDSRDLPTLTNTNLISIHLMFWLDHLLQAYYCLLQCYFNTSYVLVGLHRILCILYIIFYFNTSYVLVGPFVCTSVNYNNLLFQYILCFGWTCEINKRRVKRYNISIHLMFWLDREVSKPIFLFCHISIHLMFWLDHIFHFLYHNKLLYFNTSYVLVGRIIHIQRYLIP